MAVAFDGSTDYYLFGDLTNYSISDHDNDGTFLVWGKTTRTTGQHFMSKGASSNWEYFFMLNSVSDGYISNEFFTLAGGGYAGTHDQPTPAPNNGVWGMIGCKIDGGVRDETWSKGVDVGSDESFGAATGDGNQPLSIGRRNDSSNNYFLGDICFVLMWSNVVPDTHLVAMQNGANPFAVLPDTQLVFSPMYEVGNVGEYAQQNIPSENGTPVNASSSPPVDLLENHL